MFSNFTWWQASYYEEKRNIIIPLVYLQTTLKIFYLNIISSHYESTWSKLSHNIKTLKIISAHFNDSQSQLISIISHVFNQDYGFIFRQKIQLRPKWQNLWKHSASIYTQLVSQSTKVSQTFLKSTETQYKNLQKYLKHSYILIV